MPPTNPDLLVTAIVRNAAATEQSSRVYRLRPNKGVVGTVHIPEPPMRQYDANPRGGMRGARGIAIAGDEVYIANYNAIFRYDRSFVLVGEIMNPSCIDIHDLAFHDDQLWVASTGNDQLIAVTREGQITDTVDLWNAADIEHTFGIQRSTGGQGLGSRNSPSQDRLDTDSLHLNSFAFDTNGDLIVSLGQIRVNGHSESALLRLGTAGGGEVVHHCTTAPVPAHNVLPLGTGDILHAQTQHGQVIKIDPRTKKYEAIVSTRTGYTRGLALVNDHVVAIGVQNEVWLCDIVSGLIRECITISSDPRESVHSIACLSVDLR